MTVARTFEPSFLDSSAGRIFVAYHPPRGVARGAVVICPPMFHEQVRGYRLFALAADALASSGLGVLRFDYPGTGDSDGDEEAFTLDRAEAAARAALDRLEQLSGSSPMAVLGIRAGAYIATRLAAHRPQVRLWLWQPTGSGAQYLESLAAIDREERTSELRFGGAARAAVRAEAGVMVGYPVSGACVDALRAEPDPREAVRSVDLFIDRAVHAATPNVCGTIEIPESVAHWPLQVDMLDVPVKPWRELCAVLASQWERAPRG